MPKYSIVIATCRELSILKRCIDSIIQNTDLSNAEVIISANGCDDLVHQYLNSFQFPFRIIWNDERIGAASAKNAGFKIAEGDYIVIVDDDAIIFPPINRWLDVLEEPFRQNQAVGITGRILMCEYGKFPFVVGFCSMIKKEVFQHTGYYDTAFDPYFGEEQDFCYRASLTGFRIAQVDLNNWPIHHVCECEVTQENIPQHKSEGYCRNIHIIAKRYNSIARENLLPYVISEIDYASLPEGWFSPHDVAVYRYLVNKIPQNGKLAEVGSWQGRSLCSIASFIISKNIAVSSIDNFIGGNGVVSENPQQIKNNLIKNIEKYGISKNVSIFDTNSLDGAEKFPNEYFDLIFIDADHSEEAVKNDVESWFPKLKKNGIMAGHDAAWCFSTTSKLYPNELIMCGNIWIINKEDTLNKVSEDKPMIYDCFPFFNELDLLEIRLNELNSVVDKFILVEATKTHSGQDKPLYFQENKERFDQFLDKIIHIVVDNFPTDAIDSESVWLRERFQRDACARGLTSCQDRDIIIISDIDEIPRASTIKRSITNSVVAFNLAEYAYYFNYQKEEASYFPWVKMLPYSRFKTMTACEVRYYGWNETKKQLENLSDLTIVKNGGWHFSFMGGIESITDKIEAYAHQEYNTDEIKSVANLVNIMKQGISIYGKKYKSVEIDDSYPEYLYKNLDKFNLTGGKSPTRMK